MTIHLIDAKRLKHEEGTKEYSIGVLYNDNNNKACVIKQWGKITATGYGGVVSVTDLNHAKNYARKTVNSKITDGYEISEIDSIANGEYITEFVNVCSSKSNTYDRFASAVPESKVREAWSLIGAEDRTSVDFGNIHEESESENDPIEEVMPEQVSANFYDTHPLHYRTW